MTKTEQNVWEKKKNLKSLEKDEFLARKALSSCVPIFPPSPPSLAFRETVAIKIVRNDSIYIHIKNKKKKIYSDKNRHRQPDCKLQPSFCTRFVHIFLNCFSRYILNLLKKSLVKKESTFYTLTLYTYTCAGVQHLLYFIAGWMQQQQKAKEASSWREKVFPFYT